MPDAKRTQLKKKVAAGQARFAFVEDDWFAEPVRTSSVRDAAHRASDAGETAMAMTREAGKKLGKAIRNRVN